MYKKILAGIVSMFMAFPIMAGCVAVIRTPPPPARVEVRPASPFTGAVWIDGRWRHRHRRWVWVPGHWQRRPSPKAHWAPGHWSKTPRGWKWYPGHWRR